MSHKKFYLNESLILSIVAGMILMTLEIFTNLSASQKPVSSNTMGQTSEGGKQEEVTAITHRDSLTRALPDSGICANSYTGLDPFFAALASLNGNNFRIHIAYFGDSMIEGDLVTHPLRRKFQNRFGGKGIGFIPVTSPQPGFRNTIRQKFNDEWQVYSFTKPGLSKGFFPGLSGYVFSSEKDADVSFQSEPVYGPFKNVDILYSSANDIQIKLKIDMAKSEIRLPASSEISSFPLPVDSSCNFLSLLIENQEPGTLYGLNFENKAGVYVDNYAFRGNSGLPLTQIPVSLFSRFNALLQNKLIILHYGLNVFTPGVSDYNWYQKGMEGVIRHIKAASPGVPILMISMPDRAALIDGEYATPAELPDFIRMQKEIADRQQIAFFCLFSEMGGVNSMKSWVEGKTKLAGEDYTHPNGAGANRVADLIFQYLMKGYDSYMEKQNEIPAKPSFIP